MMDSIRYETQWSKNLSEPSIEDFIAVHRAVFGEKMTRGLFQRKYIENPYGDSIISIAYCGSHPCGIRALWRNDIGDIPSWQPVDTAVLADYRGKGIFVKMTEWCLSFLPDDAMIYNFPNMLSYKGYLKMGWKTVREYHLRLFLSAKAYQREHPVPAPYAYIQWWMKDSKILRCVNICSHWYVVSPLNTPFCYKILTEVPSRIFPLAFPAVCFYESRKTTFYNRRKPPFYVIGKNVDAEIPIWKIDAIL